MKEFNLKKFSDESPELYKAFKDYADHVFSVERNIKGKQFSAISLDDKEKVINKLFADEVAKRSNVSLSSYDGDMMHYSVNPVVKAFADSIFDRMIDMILPQVLNTSIGLISEIVNVDWGDTAKFDLDNNALYNVSKAGYRQKNTTFQQLEGQTVTLAPQAHQVSTICTLFEVLTNRKSIAKETMKVAKSIEAEMANETWDAFSTACEATTVPTALKVTNYTQESAVTLADTITSYNNGSKAVFAGTPLALNNILPANANYRYMLDDNMVKIGYIPTFMTYDVMPTPNFADYTSTTYGLKLSNKKIYVVSPASDKIIKVAVGGTLTIPSGTYENANLSQTMSTMKSWDVMAATNAIAGVITLA
jgi:hypothetical protein